MRATGLAAVMIMAAGICQAADHDFKLLEIGGYFVKWDLPVMGSPATISYAFADRSLYFENARNCRSVKPVELHSATGAIPGSKVMREFEKAAAAWERVANVSFYRAASVETANLVIGSQTEPRGYAYANVTPDTRDGVERALNDENEPVGPASVRQGDAEEAHDIRSLGKSLICLNPEIAWKIGFDGDMQIYDLRYTFMHEIGHVLGLNHAGAGGSVMSFRYDETFSTLRPGDIAGARALYGPASAKPH